MNRNAKIIAIVVIILVILGICYYSSSKSTAVEPVTTTETNDTKVSQTPVTPNTFKSIFSQSGSHQCTYEQVDSSTRSSNMVSIADGKMRGEFRTISATTTLVNIMIYSNGYLYSWREGAIAGKKSSIKTIAELPQIIPTDLTSGAFFGSSGENVSWDCHDWLKDVKAFVLPTNITFSAS